MTLKPDGENSVTTTPDVQRSRRIQGTIWALIKNAIEGVTAGFTKVLEIEGVGYRAVLEGKKLVLFLGYALPVRVPIRRKSRSPWRRTPSSFWVSIRKPSVRQPRRFAR